MYFNALTEGLEKYPEETMLAGFQLNFTLTPDLFGTHDDFDQEDSHWLEGWANSQKKYWDTDILTPMLFNLFATPPFELAGVACRMKTIYQPDEPRRSDPRRILVTVYYQLMKPKKVASKESVVRLMKKIDNVVEDAKIDAGTTDIVRLRLDSEEFEEMSVGLADFKRLEDIRQLPYYGIHIRG